MRALLASVRAPKQTCAPPAGVRALPTWVRTPCRRARPPPRRRARPTPADVRAPLLASVRALPRRRARPAYSRAQPYPHQCARLRRWWQKKIYKEGSLTSLLHHAWLCVLGLLCGLLAGGCWHGATIQIFTLLMLDLFFD
jgi:hypothetical protein